MIKFVEGNVLKSKANFIVCQVNSIDANNNIVTQITSLYPHVGKEYRKYINYCKKNNINPLGTVQYVPKDIWALGLVDTINNSYIDTFDENYQYLVNMFTLESIGSKIRTNTQAIKEALKDVKYKAQSVGATIAIAGINSNEVYKIITEVFEDNVVDVEIWKHLNI